MNRHADAVRWLGQRRAWEQRLDVLRDRAGIPVPSPDPDPEPVRLPIHETRRPAA